MSENIELTSTNVLAKWRRVFMWWQLGKRDKGDPEGDAVADHREVTMLMRTELNALAALLIQKQVFTAMEFTAQVEVEAEHLSETYSQKFPGLIATPDGITGNMPEGGLTLGRLFREIPGSPTA